MSLPFPCEVCGGCILSLRAKLKVSAQFNSKPRPDQANATSPFRCWMIDTASLGQHANLIGFKLHSQKAATTTVGEQVGLTIRLQYLCEHHWQVITAHKVPFAPTRREVRKVLHVATSLIQLQPLEEELQEDLLYNGSKQWRTVVQTCSNLSGNVAHVQLN